MTPEKTKFVNDLFNRFASDMATGALEARLQWYRLDNEILDAVRAWAISEAGYDAAQKQADLGAVLAGIPGAGNAGSRAATVKGFAQTLFSIAQSRGDPPFAPAFRDHALDAAMGRLDTLQAFQLLASAQPQISALFNTFGRFLFADPMMAMVLQQMVRAMGVLAMPREQLYDVYVSFYPDRTTGIRAAFQLALAEVQARTPGDLPGAHELAVQALRLAGQTPETEDDIQAIEQLLNLPPEFLVERDIVECASRLAQMARQGREATRLVTCIGTVHMSALRKGIVQQVLPFLADAAERLLDTGLDHEAWMSAANTAAGFAARLGRQAKAVAILAQIRQRAASDNEQRGADILESTVRWFGGDREGAFALLESVFEKTPVETRWIKALNLVQIWPPGRPGRERFVDIFCEGIAAFPNAFLLLPILLQATVQEWGDEPAAALLEHLDIRRLEANLSDAQRNAFKENMKPFARLRQRAPLGPAPAPISLSGPAT